MTKEIPVSSAASQVQNLPVIDRARSSGFVIRHSSFGFSRSRPGYLLLELILALTIFSLAIMGLVRSLQVGIQTAAILNRENDIRLGLRSFLEEIRRKPIDEMAQTIPDERLGVTFTSEVDELTVKDKNGNLLKDLYKLHAFANYTIGAEERNESVEMWIYKKQTEGKK